MPSRWRAWFGDTVSPLHMNLQVAKFQRCERAFHPHQVWMKLQLAFHLLLLTVLQLYHLPPPFPRPVNNSSRLFTRYQSLYQLLCCTTVLFKVLYYKIKVVLYFLCFFFGIICVKSIINLLKYSTIVDCVSWAARLNLLDLWTNWTYKRTLGMELVHM